MLVDYYIFRFFRRLVHAQPQAVKIGTGKFAKKDQRFVDGLLSNIYG